MAPFTGASHTGLCLSRKAYLRGFTVQVTIREICEEKNAVASFDIKNIPSFLC